MYTCERQSNSILSFRWDECGIYDIPAMIDHILERTGHEKIHYVGHSMGTTGFMVMMNSKPEYGEKVIMANFLAPVAYMENTISPIRTITPFVDDIMVGGRLNLATSSLTFVYLPEFSGQIRTP